MRKWQRAQAHLALRMVYIYNPCVIQSPVAVSYFEFVIWIFFSYGLAFHIKMSYIVIEEKENEKN
jgi:hypothetical protein